MVYKTNDESYAKCETKIEFEDIENKWFIIINNRIYLKED